MKEKEEKNEEQVSLAVAIRPPLPYVTVRLWLR